MVQDQYKILIFLASQYNTVPYDLLMTSLQINSERELEDFIIQAIYQDIIQGRLNPKKHSLEVTDWNSNRLNEPDLQFMAETLVHWGNHCKGFVNTLDDQINKSNLMVAQISESEKKINEEVEVIKKAICSEEFGGIPHRKMWNLADKGEWNQQGGSGGAVNKSVQKPETKRFKSGPAKKRGGGNN